MTQDPCWVPPDAEVPKAADYMKRAGIHRLLVMENGKLLGIVSAMDVVRAVAEHRLYVRRYLFGRRGSGQERDSGLYA